MKRRYAIKISMLAGLLAGIAGITSPAHGAAAGDTESTSRLLSDAKTQAYAISVDASILESYMRQPTLSWQSHAAEINRMKDDINATAKTVTKLMNAKSQAEPWQATAIDRIVPYMKEIAEDTTNAIEYLNKNQAKPLTVGPYKDYIEANADTTKELASLIANFVDYGNNKNRSESLRKSLELPAK
jgi:phage-related minor tail protein